MEAITEGIIKVDGFESLNQNHNFLGFSVEKVLLKFSGSYTVLIKKFHRDHLMKSFLQMS